MYHDVIIDIECYKNYGDGHFAQEMFVFHGYDDVYWFNFDEIDEILPIIKEQLKQIKERFESDANQ